MGNTQFILDTRNCLTQTFRYLYTVVSEYIDNMVLESVRSETNRPNEIYTPDGRKRIEETGDVR
jgi:hypothetical protein